MRINKLEISDFRVFRGVHTISLTPRHKYGKSRPIVLFGGLNGAGKTSILSAIRLALYGKQAIGPTISQKDYETFLRDSVHQSPTLLVNPEGARISLDFTHSNLGKVSEYYVTRDWTLKGKSVAESLTIAKDGQLLAELSQDQCQSFLNELVPLGVSELFFFDGEKISELAEEKGSVALGTAIKRLLGIDIIERLNADLSTYMRREAGQQLPETSRQELSGLESNYLLLESNITQLNNEKGSLLNDIFQLEKTLTDLESRFSAKGGAWADQRAEMRAKRELLEKQRVEIEDDLRERLADLFPLSLAPRLLDEIDQQLRAETELKQAHVFFKAMSLKLPMMLDVMADELGNLDITFRSSLQRALQLALVHATSTESPTPIIHDLNESDSDRVLMWVQEAKCAVPTHVDKLKNKLENVYQQIDTVQLQLDRAPEEELLLSDLDDIKNIQAQISVASERRRAISESIRNHAWQAIELVRAMRKIESQLALGGQRHDTYGLAARTKGLLVDFASELRNRKIQSLQSYFRDAFVRLARKNDIVRRVEIQPDTFEVKLFGKNEKPIFRDQLSAGEKQIYAIAMLESLMKASGRTLPVIVDTPLGRLDSNHRDKLINNYFPTASHQTIILSTDTEVDERFYNALSPHISHAYHVSYDPDEHASHIEEGYFWRHKEIG